MKHNKIIKRPEGNSVNIEVSLSIESFADRHCYHISISYRAKGKIKWTHFPMRMCQVENPHCTEAEILEAKMEFWKKLKPK